MSRPKVVKSVGQLELIEHPPLAKAKGRSKRADAALALFDRLHRTRSDRGYVRVLMALNAELMTMSGQDLARYYAGVEQRRRAQAPVAAQEETT